MARPGRLTPVLHDHRDRLAVATLIILPTVIFGAPAIVGHPIINGDNLIQNFPLRVLAGSQISAGHAPLLDPYLWSGTPLLGGFNAGALFPLTLLFAVLPGVAAWAVNQIAIFAAAAVGLYALCRSYRLMPMASLLGAVSFAFAGAMTAQIVHIGLVAGIATVPWVLLSVKKLADRLRDTSPETRADAWRTAGWVILGVASGGCTILSGEPRAVADAAIVAFLFILWQVWTLSSRPRTAGARTAALAAAGRTAFTGRRGVFLLQVLVIAAGAAALGLAQLLPGIQFLHQSQRSALSYTEFSAGSLPVGWTLLLAVPDLLGGSGSFGQPSFVGGYQITEVTGYVGILPLVAFCALLVSLRRGATRARDWGIFHVIALGGVFMALGGDSFMGRVLWHIPMYSGQRLQSRNIVVADLALAVLLAFWVDGLVRDDSRSRAGQPQPGGGEVDWASITPDERQARRAEERRAARRTAAERWVNGPWGMGISAAVPLMGIVACILAITWGPGFVHLLGRVNAGATAHYRNLIPTLVASLFLCTVAANFAAFHRLMPPAARRFAVACFVVVDIVVFTGTCIVDLQGTAITSAQKMVSTSLTRTTTTLPPPPSAAPAGANSGSAPGGSAPGGSAPGGSAPGGSSPGGSSPGGSSPGDRFAIFDPNLENRDGLAALGQPDLNILDASYSIQGYGSLTPGAYADVTGTHGQDVFSTGALAAGVFDSLDLGRLYTLPGYMTRTIHTNQGGGPQNWQLFPGGTRGWSFGTALSLTGVQVTNVTSTMLSPDTASGVAVGLVLPDGSQLWPPAWYDSQPGTTFLVLDSPSLATGLLVRNISPSITATVENLIVTTSSGQRTAMEGPLAGLLDPSQWTYSGQNDGYSTFARTAVPSPVSFETVPPNTPPPAPVRGVTTGSAAAQAACARHGTTAPCWIHSSGDVLGDGTIEVATSAPALVIRSVGSMPGWHATLESVAGLAPTDIPITTHGLVQSVEVPAGVHRVVFTYRPFGTAVSLWVTGLTALFLFAASAWVLYCWRRSARTTVLESSVGTRTQTPTPV